MYTELHWVEGPWPGKLAVSARPRGGDWLDEELASWRKSGVDEVVSLLTPDEAENLGLQDESVHSWDTGMRFRSFPIVDRWIPESKKDALRLIESIDAALAAGSNISIHCRQGIGRTGLIAASLLVARGILPDDAFERISQARGVAVPETEGQRTWVEELAAEVAIHPLLEE
jgi:protein-tyrosine phosphatase